MLWLFRAWVGEQGVGRGSLGGGTCMMVARRYSGQEAGGGVRLEENDEVVQVRHLSRLSLLRETNGNGLQNVVWATGKRK
jgi:hypothetical protein